MTPLQNGRSRNAKNDPPIGVRIQQAIPRPVHRQDFDLDDGAALTILIRVEASQNGKLWEASPANLSITESTGNIRQIRRLADLPMELHWWPSKTPPKDLPLPGRPT
jgi:hypothetical protein